jgi:hypothetical protein
VSWQAAATSAESAALSMMARSSRNHSIQVPADNMMASRPQWSRPVRLRVMMGMVPAGPRPFRSGGPSPVHWSSIPPVPKVALACPGRMHPWPIREACWSPAMPAMSGLPSRMSAAPAGPDESTMAGIMAAGMASAAITSALHPAPSLRRSPVTPALVASVTWSAPPDRVHATQVSTVPNRSSPRSALARSGSAPSSSAATLVAEALGGMRIP